MTPPLNSPENHFEEMCLFFEPFRRTFEIDEHALGMDYDLIRHTSDSAQTFRLFLKTGRREFSCKCEHHASFLRTPDDVRLK